MSFKFVKSLGGQEAYMEDALSNVSVAAGDILYWASGYLSNAYASVTCALVAGVAKATVDNSAGSAGDKVIEFDPSPLSVFEVGTADTMARAYVGVNAALASAGTITSNAAGTDITGVAKILGMISTSKALVRINYSSEADT